MTAEVIALCRDEPSAGATLAALNAAGPGMTVRPVERAGLLQLCDDDGHALVTIESPLLVRVPGEAGRILGGGVDPPHPAWWVEAHAHGPAAADLPGDDGPGGQPAAHPAGGAAARPDGRDLARRFAEALVAATGGCTWPSR